MNKYTINAIYETPADGTMAILRHLYAENPVEAMKKFFKDQEDGVEICAIFPGHHDDLLGNSLTISKSDELEGWDPILNKGV